MNVNLYSRDSVKLLTPRVRELTANNMHMNSSASSVKQLKARVSESDNSKVKKWTLMNDFDRSVFAQICRYKTHKKINRKILSPYICFRSVTKFNLLHSSELKTRKRTDSCS